MFFSHFSLLVYGNSGGGVITALLPCHHHGGAAEEFQFPSSSKRNLVGCRSEIKLSLGREGKKKRALRGPRLFKTCLSSLH